MEFDYDENVHMFLQSTRDVLRTEFEMNQNKSKEGFKECLRRIYQNLLESIDEQVDDANND